MFPPRDGETLLPRRRRRAAHERRERLRARVLLQRRGLLGRGRSGLARRRSTAAWAAATNPALPPAQREQALAAYGAAARRSRTPWGLGLRRHYLHASWTRGGATSVWTGAVRVVVGLDDGGWALTPGVGYAPRGNVTLNLDTVLLLGPRDASTASRR